MLNLIKYRIIGWVSFLILFFAVPCSVISQKDVAAEYPDWMYQKRMETLNQQSPILLEYNDNVRAYIDVYMIKRRDHFQEILNKSKLYFPIFEEYLDRYNLPLELKYLAVVESALDPKAKSSSGAMGLWQFMLNSGKMFDLDVTTFTDDRCDVRKSTEAACKYLQYLYTTFGDWQLALAAYNGGAGELQKAIERSGKKNYWELRPFLTEQMRGYVPAFIAVAYSMNFYGKHGFEINPSVVGFTDVDSVYLQKPSSLSKIANLLSLDLTTLANLNPIFTKDFIPVIDSPTLVFLPKGSVSLFVKNEKQLYAQIFKNQIYKDAVNQKISSGFERVKTIHVVSNGEYFHKIAMTYNCRIDEIMSWNKMKTKKIYPGQKLVVWQNKRGESNFFFAVNEVENQVYIHLNLLQTPTNNIQVNQSSNSTESFIK